MTQTTASLKLQSLEDRLADSLIELSYLKDHIKNLNSRLQKLERLNLKHLNNGYGKNVLTR